MSCDAQKPIRELASLDPRYRQRFIDFLAAFEATFPQFNAIVIEARRTPERQACLLHSGASKVQHSNHQDGIAIDWVPLRHANSRLDYRVAVFRNIYRKLDPRQFGLTSGAHLWGWDQGHLQIVEAQGRGKDLEPQLESYS